MRPIILAAAVLALTACPSYDSYPYLSNGKGLVPPDEYAKYGPEQAIAVAIGREYGKAHTGSDVAALAKQADDAVAYSKKFPLVKGIVADTLSHRLVVTFVNGWSAQVTPITDGKAPDATAGLPSGK